MQMKMKNVLLTGTPIGLHQVQTFTVGRFANGASYFDCRLKNVRRILRGQIVNVFNVRARNYQNFIRVWLV